MPSRNFVCVAGHLGKDAEERFTKGGVSVVSFNLGVTTKLKEGERTEWVGVKAFGGSVAHAKDRLLKGVGVTVTGRLQTESWKGEGGVEKSRTFVYADSVAVWVKDAEAPKRDREPGDETPDIPF